MIFKGGWRIRGLEVLHGGELDGSLIIWAETSDPAGPGPRGPQSGAGRYPFGVGARRLGRILDSLGVGAGKGGRGKRGGTRRMCSVNVWLPTRANGSPIPSSGMIDGYASRPSGARRVPWVVDAAELSEGGATGMLGQITGSRAVEYDAGSIIIIGSDLAYMAESVRLAGLIVAGQQYLPHIEPVPGAEGGGGRRRYEVSWNPVITAEYSEQFESLSGRMPGAVRAITKARDAGAGQKGRARGGRGAAPSYRTDGPRNPPQAALLRFVRRIVNYLVRDAVSAGPRAPAAGPGFDSVHDAWMHHLRSPGPTEISGPAAGRLHEQVEEWQRPVSLQAGSPLRLCFRLEEPAGSDGAWLIRYLLQPRSDPSLLVPADKAWNARSSAVALPRGVNAREALLTSLGRASRIMPALADGLDAAAGAGGGASMGGYATDAQGAYRFLTREAAALRQAGYGVILPAWWTGRGPRARIRARADVRAPRMKARGLFDFRSVVSFDWKVAIGGQEMTLKELRDLARAKAPLVRMRGEWAEVSPEDIRQAVRFLQKGGGSGRAPFLDVIRMGAGAVGVPGAGAGSGGIDVEVTSGDGHIRRILDQLAGKTKLEDLAQPAGFSGALRPYQLRGFSWMAFLQKWGLGGCLADDMGLGKTIQVLALIQRHVRQQAGARKPFLLVCPTSVISNWKREAGRFTPELDVAVHHGADRARGAAAFRRMAGGHDVVVSSYGLLHRDLKTLRDAGWGGIVLDEAQNIKNQDTKQARASRAVIADCRFALTGTPVENNVGDLWSIMEFLNPGLLGGQSSFKRDFFVPIQMLQDAGAAERLKAATGPFVLRRLKTDKSIISDLPEKVEAKTYCQLTREQATLYEAVIEDVSGVLGMGGPGGGGGGPGAAGRGPQKGKSDVSAFRRKGLILAALTKLKQVCDHPAVFLKDNSQSSGGDGGDGRALRQADAADRDAVGGDGGRRQRPRVHAVRGDGPHHQGPPPGGAGPRDALPARGDAEEPAGRDDRALPGGV